MDEKLLVKGAQLSKKRIQTKRWKKLVSVLACVVVFCTTYALILPAITMERESFCGFEEHTHEEKCYETKLICTMSETAEEQSEEVKNAEQTETTEQTDSVKQEEATVSNESSDGIEIVSHVHGAECYVQEKNLICTVEETEGHIHSDACKGVEKTVICGQEEFEGHTHDETCVSIAAVNVCGREESEGHTHDETCVEQTENIICGKEESEEHVHDETCVEHTENIICGKEESEKHVHDETCAEQAETIICGQEESQGHVHDENCYTDTECFICGLEEIEGHQHMDSCYETIDVLTCTLEETTEEELAEAEEAADGEVPTETEEAADGEVPTETGEAADGEVPTETEEAADGETPTEEAADTETPVEEEQLVSEDETVEVHVHDESCYEQVLICELEEHEHMLACYSDPTADLETTDNWEAALPKELTGVWAEDIIAVAKSQLGYAESTKNYQVAEGEVTKGYTRYGAWYGDAYGDWSAMFVAFCLNYAQIDSQLIPWSADCQQWIEILAVSPYELYHSREEYTPELGNIIFLDANKDGIADQVGIITELIAENNEAVTHVKAIQGDSLDCVQYCTYSITDANIMGYAQLPDEESEVVEYVTITQTDEWLTVTATFEQGILPEDAVLTIHWEDENASEWDEALQQMVEKRDYALLTTQYLSFGFVDSEGNELIPEGEVLLTVNFNYPMEANPVQAYALVDTTGNDTSSSEWNLYSIDGENSITSKNDATIETSDNNALESVTFAYQPSAVYAIAALSYNGAEITDFARLQTAIETAIEDNDNDAVIALDGNITATEAIDIPAGANIVVDLNGYTITVDGNYSLFTVNGGTLIIRNSQQQAEQTETIDTTSDNAQYNIYGNVASYDKDSKVLTYYITESEISNSENGTTIETLVKHTVTLNGEIKAGSQPAVTVGDGGTFTLESGAITGGTNRAIVQTGGTLNLDGGYICGNTVGGDYTNEDTANGGAVYATSGTVHLTGTVLAANNTAGRGGAFAITGENTTLEITGGAISGNHSTYADGSGEWGAHYGGGGLYCDSDSSVTMSGGYITNNKSDATGYFDGGGGVLVDGSNTTFTISGGYITGNEANSGGGIRNDWRSASLIVIEGGYICSNHARTAEGGGVSINLDGTAKITAGYINNNRTDTDNHWGGGGVFCSNGSKIFMLNALITENEAGGFGGGVAGCSTGRVYITVKEGGAIYDNTAAGENMSGDDSTKSEDHLLGKQNEVFKKYGYQDYFCALNSVVDGAMLGGHAANWKGSADGYPVTAGKDETLIASSIMGLTAYPTSAGKDAAEEFAELYINGNYSYTHGGGILANGYLMIGEIDDVDVYARIEMSGTKSYLDADNKSLVMEDGQFKFSLIDADTGAVVTTGKNDVDGKIVFADRISFSKEGTYVYLLKEDAATDSSIIVDTSVYRITITVSCETDEQWQPAFVEGQYIAKNQYLIDRILIEKQVDGTWETISDKSPSNSEDSAIKLAITGDATFVNYKFDTTNVKVIKQWAGEDTHPSTVTVGLYQNGTLWGEKITLSDNNSWTYVWEDLPLNTAEGTPYTYTVQEDAVSGYQVEYEYYNKVGDAGGYWIPAESLEVGAKYILVSPDGQQVLYVTDANVNERISANDKMSISKGTGSITIDGKTYTDYYPEERIPKRSAYTAQTGETSDDITGTMLLSKEISSAILVEPNGNANVLKGGTGISGGWFSLFSYSNGKLIGLEDWGKDSNLTYVVVYDTGNARFSAVRGAATDNVDNAVKLYTYAKGPVTDKEMVYVITNTKDEDITYGLDITKVSGDDQNVTLSGAHFELRNTNGNALHFIKTGEGAYEWSSTSVEGTTTTDLVTAMLGKLVLNGLPAGDYVLHETVAPTGYEVAEDKNITLGDPASPTLKFTIVDQRKGEYVLPETGGMGTSMYTVGGILLILAAALLYIKGKNQKKGGYLSTES